MDIEAGVILGILLLIYGVKTDKVQNEDMKGKRNEGQESQLGIPLSHFVSERYKISFKYPKDWEKNPRYMDKYEGKTGFFEVTAFAGKKQESIDEAIEQQVKESFQPYGSHPTIRHFTIDGEPAAVIYPSEDQSDFFIDRDAAIVVQYKEPLNIEGEQYPYVTIFVTKEYVPLIVSTLKFIGQEEMNKK